MGRRRKASLWGGTGRREDRGKKLPGYYVRFSDYVNGTRVQRSRCFLSLATARQWVRQYNARADLQAVGEVIPISFEDASNEFSEGVAGLAFETARSYGTSLGLFIEEMDRACPLCEVTPRDVDRFIARRSASSTPSTVAKHLRSLNVFFKWAASRGYVAQNPIPLATSHPRGVPRERPPVDDALLARIIEAADTPDRKLAIAIAATTGLDRGKIERLTPSMIDRDLWAVVFVRQKTGKPNAVPLPDVLVPEIQKRLSEKQPGEPLLAGLSHQGHERDWWRSVRKKAGAPGLMFRDLRAVATSRLRRIGLASPREAQQLLGHESLMTTMTHYETPDPGVTHKLRSLPVPGFPPPAGPSTS
jgi:integrase